MAWVYSVEPIPDINPDNGYYEPHGVRIVKSFYSETGDLVVSVDSTATEAIAAGEVALYSEYMLETREAFKSQIDFLFDSISSGNLPMVSVGTTLGNKLTSALGEAKALREVSNG